MSVAWMEGEEVVSAAFPFDQGVRDKVPQATLSLAADPNLPEEEWRYLLAWLGRHRLVFMNAKYDLMMLRAGTRHWSGVELEESYVYDIGLGSRELDPTDDVGLDAQARRRQVGDGTGKDERFKLALAEVRKRFGEKRYDLVEWDAMEGYAAKDAELTTRLAMDQIQRVSEGEGNVRALDRAHALSRVLYAMERRGMEYDVATSLDCCDMIEKRKSEIADGLPFKPGVNSAKHYFFQVAGVTPYAVTAKKQDPKLDEEVLRKMVADRIPFAAEYAEWTKLDRAQSMWYGGYPTMVGADGRLRTTFRQTKVVSGRIAVERVQLHAIPKDDKAIEGIPTVRSLFRAKAGHSLWNLDLSQAELRVAAKYANCQLMIEMLEAGEDLHGITTEEVFQIKPGHPEFKFKRDIGKRLTFGGIFGIGARTYQSTLSKLAGIYMPLPECEAVVNRWRRMYPEYMRAKYRAEKLVTERGWVRQLPGTEYETRSYFGAHEYPHTGWNRMVQGSLARFNELWLVQVEGICPGDELLLTVHDSVVLEIENGKEEALCQEVALQGSKLATSLFGIEMPIEVGPWHK